MTWGRAFGLYSPLPCHYKHSTFCVLLAGYILYHAARLLSLLSSLATPTAVLPCCSLSHRVVSSERRGCRRDRNSFSDREYLTCRPPPPPPPPAVPPVPALAAVLTLKHKQNNPRSDKGLDLLVSFRVYDPDGDQEEDEEEPLPEGVGGHQHRQGPGFAGQAGAAAGAAAWSSYPSSSAAARREELEAMAAAAAPGGLAARPRIVAAAAGEAGRGGAEGRGEAAGAGAAIVGVADAADGGGGGGGGAAAGVGDDAAIAAPAADGWGLAAAARGSDSAGGSNDGGDGAGVPVDVVEGGTGGARRFFGLFASDEWISASSSRIEKLNSRAPWKNSWTEEAPVNDRNDPYLTEGGNRLVFAVTRAPVDGAPALVRDGWRAFEARWYTSQKPGAIGSRKSMDGRRFGVEEGHSGMFTRLRRQVARVSTRGEAFAAVFGFGLGLRVSPDSSRRFTTTPLLPTPAHTLPNPCRFVSCSHYCTGVSFAQPKVANINAFGQEGGFENLITRLSPPPPAAEEPAPLPAPLAEAPAPPSSVPSPSAPGVGGGENLGVSSPSPPPPSPPPNPLAEGESGAISSVTVVAATTTVAGGGIRAARNLPRRRRRRRFLSRPCATHSWRWRRCGPCWPGGWRGRSWTERRRRSQPR